MKMVKSLLLGSAAGLVAVAGAQAADLPVKAKPVQYVKICSLYGAGFYYVPGTDMCIKIGGWVRWETAWNNNGTSTGSVFTGFRDNRFTDQVWWRSRGYITADARDQTAYGTVRGYLAVGFSGNNAVTFDANRAFIQWAGFTFGLAQSFYDFYSSAAVGYHGWIPSEDTGDAGNEVAAYTFQFGNGWSSTIAAEFGGGAANINKTTIINTAVGPSQVAGGVAVSSYGALKAPDIVGNVRVDQAWGSAQIMGVLHDVNALYYNPVAASATGLELGGGPSDKWGYVVGAGLKLNAPMFGKGDYFQGEVNYTQGDMRRLAVSAGGGNYFIQNGTSSAALGVLTDAVYGGTVAGGTATNLDLTTGWSFNASYEHYWSTDWKTSLYGSYLKASFNSEANANLCVLEGFGAGAGSAALATGGCNNDWNFWTIGSRTQWNVTKDFYMGVDVAYGKLHGLQTTAGIFPVAGLPTNTNTVAVRTISDQDILSVRFRVHRDFYP